MSAHNFAEEDVAKSTLYKTASILGVISRTIDLTTLDGVTISYDYDKSLMELDRGYETTHVLTATKDVAIGVAMTPSVMREGILRSHMVFNAAYISGILEKKGEETDAFYTALHLLAHESAHVEVTASFDKAFPNRLLKHQHADILDNLRWQVILACWDEYTACRICGDIGYDPLDGYAETFIAVLSVTKTNCIEAIKSYRIHGDVDRVVCSIYGNLGNLLKYASYFFGALEGIDKEVVEFPDVQSTLKESFYEDDIDTLTVLMKKLTGKYGKWQDMTGFEEIGDLVEAMAEREGILAKRMKNHQLHFDIPYRMETMPS